MNRSEQPHPGRADAHPQRAVAEGRALVGELAQGLSGFTRWRTSRDMHQAAERAAHEVAG